MTYGKGRSTPIKRGSETKLPISTDSGSTMKYCVINKEWQWFVFIDDYRHHVVVNLSQFKKFNIRNPFRKFMSNL